MTTEPRSGLIDRLKGKAKEAVGSAVGNADLAQEGRLEQQTVDATHAARALEAEADQAQEEAEVDAELAETELERERVNAELDARAEAAAAEKEQGTRERELADRAAAEKAAADRRAATEQSAAGRKEVDALHDRAETQSQIDRLERGSTARLRVPQRQVAR